MTDQTPDPYATAHLWIPATHETGDGLSEADRHLAQQAGSRIPSAIGRLSAAAESNNSWCGAAVVMSVFGGRRGRTAAVSGLAAFALTLAVERVQSGSEYPVDVTAGAVVGLGSAWLILRMSRLLRNWLQ
ncbi:phosphatase PAP2 family protein [Streptomyces sp. NPDC002698]|uniref:phosphatase PAP2 family protein n=1 Tax=Streptomyces sp. NPDC002698 TaxID=3364660 RepID=UPI0036A12A49